jgi:phage repressor protein C with HTH and peptisase S24 domain
MKVADMDEVNADWIKSRLTGVRGEQRRLAEYVGISYDKLNRILSGARQVQAKEVPDFIAFFDGRDTMSADLAALPFEIEETETDHPETMIDVYAVEASAGTGSVVGDLEMPVAQLTFPPNYLRRITTSHPRHLRIISVKGDSMAPTLQDDDVVMLDASKTDLSWDGLFVLRYNDALHVKRVSRTRGQGFVRIISDNPLYEPFDLPAAEVAAVGKVIWSGGKIG